MTIASTVLTQAASRGVSGQQPFFNYALALSCSQPVRTISRIFQFYFTDGSSLLFTLSNFTVVSM